MTRKQSPTTPTPSDAHAIKDQKEKVVLLSGVAVMAPETRAHLPHTIRLTHATIVPKVKARPTDNTPKAKAKTTIHAALALANPNLTPVLTVVAPVTTLATASNALLMRKQRQRQSNKPTKTF